MVHYETVTRQPMVSQFRKGASFRVVYALQKDKFDNPANSFWISTEQHYDTALEYRMPVYSTTGDVRFR